MDFLNLKMKIEILHRPAYAMANITLDSGEEIITETNSMLSMSEQIEIETETEKEEWKCKKS